MIKCSILPQNSEKEEKGSGEIKEVTRSPANSHKRARKKKRVRGKEMHEQRWLSSGISPPKAKVDEDDYDYDDPNDPDLNKFYGTEIDTIIHEFWEGDI